MKAWETCSDIRCLQSADSSLGSKLPSDVIGLSRTTPDQAIGELHFFFFI